MTKSYRFLSAVLLIFLIPAVAGAQLLYTGSNFLEFNSIGGGARAAGMGGAYLGIAEGEMAYSWNPAAMIFTDKTKIGLQLASISDNNNSVIARRSYLYVNPNIQSLETKRDHTYLDFGGFTAPFYYMDRDWAVGGGYRNYIDMSFEYSNPGFNGTKDSFNQDRGIDAVSAAFANKIMDGIGVGLTLNRYIRNSEYNQYFGASTMYISPGLDTSLVDFWENANSHFSGFNMDLGLAADFGIVKGGLVIHTPLSLEQQVKLTQSLVIPPDPIGAINRVTITYDMPLSYSAGIAITPMENLTMAFDFDSRPLSKTELKKDWEYEIIPDTAYNPGWEDLNQFRVGLEYIFNSDFANIPLRVGFRNQPEPGDQLLSIINGVGTYGDQISTNLFSFGSGLYFEEVWFDLAYQLGSSSYDRTVNYGTPTIYEIKKDYSRLFVSVGMYF